MAEIKVGDLVQLKSGGPLMTVEDAGSLGFTDGKQRALCVWFADDKRQQQAWLVATLKHQDEIESP
jgi:uncharacterized protein YodC (DUF2158 family)